MKIQRLIGAALAGVGRPLAEILVLLAVLILPGHASAQSWNVSSGNWDVADNWSPSGIPTSHDVVSIDNSGTAIVPVGVAGVAEDLFVGNYGAGSLNVSGSVYAYSWIVIGNHPGSSGTVTINTGGEWDVVRLDIGSQGTGTLIIDGGNGGNGRAYIGNGTVTVTNGGTWSPISLGLGSSGTLNLGTGGVAGVINTATVSGDSGAAVNFNHTGCYTFAPQLTGNLALNKLGAGTTILSSSNTYTGATTVESGKLKLDANGSIASSTSVDISPGGIFDTTALACGTFTMLGSQTFKFTLESTGVGSAGLLDATGLDITTGVVDFATLGTLDDAAYVIADYTSLTGSTFASVVNLPNGYVIDYHYKNGTKIAVAAVPEPGSFVLMGLGVAGLVLRRRKSARK